MSVLVRVVEGYSPEGVIILEFDTDFRRPSVGGVVFQRSPSDKVAGEKQKINTSRGFLMCGKGLSMGGGGCYLPCCTAINYNNKDHGPRTCPISTQHRRP